MSTSDVRPASKGSLLVIFLTVFVDLLGFGMVLPLLPLYAEIFQEDKKGWLLGSLMASFSVMQFIVAPLWGRLSDRIGRRPVLMIGLLGSVAFYFLFGIATVQKNLFLLFVSRIGAGIAGATIPTAQAYIADCTTHETRAKGMALIGAAFGLGFTLGPLFGALALVLSPEGGATQVSAWPGYAASLLSMIALILAYFKLPESLQPSSRSASKGWLSITAIPELINIPALGLAIGVSFFSILAFGSFETTLALSLKDKRGFELNLKDVMYFFAYLGLVLTVVQGGIVRRLATRISEGKLAAMGTLISALGFALMTWASQTLEVLHLMVAVAVQVSGFAFVTPSINSLISRWSPPDRQGSVLGLNQGLGAIARIIGPLYAIPLHKVHISLPYGVGIGLAIASLCLLIPAVWLGKDYGQNSRETRSA